MAHNTNIVGGSTGFSTMMENGFGIVTVMNAKVYNCLGADEYAAKTAYDIAGTPGKELCEIKTLKIANVSQEGPTKTITGGQFSNPLIKFGKTARLEMQDALGKADVIECLGGGFREWDGTAQTKLTGLHFGEDFAGPKMIIGESFFIDQKSGKQVPVTIIFYQFLPDSIFNLTQDAEGDATVFDLNGDLLTTIINVGNNDGSGYEQHGVFYSIIEKTSATPEYTIDPATLKVFKAGVEVTAGVQYSSDDRNTWATDKPKYVKDNRYWVSVVEKGVTVFEDYVIATTNAA